jgi:trehalose 6-phosphate phosphatase
MEPAGVLLSVDYDGTLAPIVERPELAVPAEGAVAALAECVALFGTVAVVTGRPAGTVVALGGLHELDVVVLGHYGLERWTREGGIVAPPPHPGVTEVRLAVRDLAGVRIEDKGLSITVHTRESADPDATFAALRPWLEKLAADAGLELLPGRYALELRPPGVDKGVALRALAEERGARHLVVVGDDIGDIPAFDLAREVGGFTVFADSAEGPGELRERADLVVPGPPGVVAYLESLCEAARRGR